MKLSCYKPRLFLAKLLLAMAVKVDPERLKETLSLGACLLSSYLETEKQSLLEIRTKYSALHQHPKENYEEFRKRVTEAIKGKVKK